MSTTARERAEVIARLTRLNVSYEDAKALRRIANTLHNWFELECGTGDERVTRSIERDEEHYYVCTQCGHKGYGEQSLTCNCQKCGDVAPIRHQASGKPFMRVQYMDRQFFGDAASPQWIDKKFPVPDRETGARKRLAKLMAGYKRRLVAYIQGDCRGASLYLLRKGKDIKRGENIDCVYSRGVAIY